MLRLCSARARRSATRRHQMVRRERTARTARVGHPGTLPRRPVPAPHQRPRRTQGPRARTGPGCVSGLLLERDGCVRAVLACQQDVGALVTDHAAVCARYPVVVFGGGQQAAGEGLVPVGVGPAATTAERRAAPEPCGGCATMARDPYAHAARGRGSSALPHRGQRSPRHPRFPPARRHGQPGAGAARTRPLAGCRAARLLCARDWSSEEVDGRPCA